MNYTTMNEIIYLTNSVFNRFNLGFLCNEIKVEFNNRFCSRLGDASYQDKLIRFSTQLWWRATPLQRYEVIIHEACHIVADVLFLLKHTTDNTAHGPCWKECMRACGLQPKRCHNVSTEGLKVRVPVKCACMTHMISKNKATRMRAGMSYKCLKCHHPIYLVR